MLNGKDNNTIPHEVGNTLVYDILTLKETGWEIYLEEIRNI